MHGQADLLGGEPDRHGVEVAAVQDPVADGDRVVGDPAGLAGQDVTGVVELVEHGAEDLRGAAHAVRLLQRAGRVVGHPLGQLPLDQPATVSWPAWPRASATPVSKCSGLAPSSAASRPPRTATARVRRSADWWLTIA